MVHLRMPKLGLTMTEGTLSQWLVPPGSSFRQGDLVAVVETDKIASDLEAPADGELLEVLVREGETVPVGALLARCRFADDAGLPGQDEPTTTAAATPQMVAEAVPASPDAESAPSVPALMNTSAATIGGRVVATPYARRLARAGDVDLRALAGSGPGGRIVARDVVQVPDSAPTLATANDSFEPTPTASAANLTRLSLEIAVEPLDRLMVALNRHGRAPEIGLPALVTVAAARALDEASVENPVIRVVTLENGAEASRETRAPGLLEVASALAADATAPSLPAALTVQDFTATRFDRAELPPPPGCTAGLVVTRASAGLRLTLTGPDGPAAAARLLDAIAAALENPWSLLLS